MSRPGAHAIEAGHKVRIGACVAVAACVAGGIMERSASAGEAPAATPPAAADSLAPFAVRELVRDGERFRYALYLPAGYDPARAWPCVVFLHGSGECGVDGVAPTRVGLGPALSAHPERWPCIAVFPQKPRDDEEWEEHEDLVFLVLAEVRRTCAVDSARIALTGISQGGHGVWLIAARHPQVWSRIAPVCGYGRARTIARRVATIPVWAFHGLKDDLVDPRDTQEIVAAIHEVRRGRGLVPDGPAGARATLYPELNHGSWDAAYAEPELPVWLLGVRREQ